MSLKDKINQDLKEAMKSGDKIKLETIRSIRALILEFEKSGAGREINSEDEMNMLNSAVKKRKDSIEQFRNGGREELALKEEKELEGIPIGFESMVADSLDVREVAIEELMDDWREFHILLRCQTEKS